MTSQTKDYSVFDIPEVLQVLFHPRPDLGSHRPHGSSDLTFDVEGNVSIGARFHAVGKQDPIILFFHGNGEIASDYDDLAPLFTRMGLNFMVFDYRGYGRSTGMPTVTHMMADCRVLFEQALKMLGDQGYEGRIIVMGRSLGSASALEIASAFPDRIDAMIIESGFAYIMPLLSLLGLYTSIPGISEEAGPENHKKITSIQAPTLVIHAEHDHIIPFSDGQTLYDNSGAKDKTFLEIKGADHNTIFYSGLEDYMQAVFNLANKLRQ